MTLRKITNSADSNTTENCMYLACVPVITGNQTKLSLKEARLIFKKIYEKNQCYSSYYYHYYILYVIPLNSKLCLPLVVTSVCVTTPDWLIHVAEAWCAALSWPWEVLLR